MKREYRKIHALTLWEPHSSLILNGAKIFETRHWKKPHGVDLLAIHAGKRIDWECFEGDERRNRFLWALKLDRRITDDELQARLPESAVLCVCETEPSILTTGAAPYQKGMTRARWEEVTLFGDFSKGRYAWPVKPVLICQPPIKCKGAQGLWKLPMVVERAIREALGPLAYKEIL